MWKLADGNLIHTTDVSRIKFRTNISESILESLKLMAAANNTHVNYLIESGLQAVLIQDVISFNKESRPKDRVQYKTTYDKELLESTKVFAKKNNLFINDVIEYSVGNIDIENVKKNSYRFRVE
ncbi:rRNA methyltransferase [Sporosarcina sp. ANT_H38]|uniref:rRNA methyltransferase n=1 Tax=Sporosarcina sp. ANT_H38 TaxID=2597358 RepID=UPI0011F14003|nr:rRNA methyltransferase [Sporosarcina sp. ANT_H38]KAA0965746.1 rRNA methyltransferase [Sporosarcina sp. ANT_H38]